MEAVQAVGPGPEAKALIQAALEKAASISPEQRKERLASGGVILVDVRQGSEIPIIGRVLPHREQKEIPPGCIEIKTFAAVPEKKRHSFSTVARAFAVRWWRIR